MNLFKRLSRNVGGRPGFQRALNNLVQCACAAPRCKSQLSHDSCGKQTRPAFSYWLNSLSQGTEIAALKAVSLEEQASGGRALHLSAWYNVVELTSTFGQHVPTQAARSAQQSHGSLSACTGLRRFSTIGEVDIRERVEDINSKFAEAREEIDLAMEAKDTVFFNEEALGAKKMVEEVLENFRSLLDEVDERRRGELQRSMGMKMEQLKAEAAQLDDASS